MATLLRREHRPILLCLLSYLSRPEFPGSLITAVPMADQEWLPALQVWARQGSPNRQALSKLLPADATICPLGAPAAARQTGQQDASKPSCPICKLQFASVNFWLCILPTQVINPLTSAVDCRSFHHRPCTSSGTCAYVPAHILCVLSVTVGRKVTSLPVMQGARRHNHLFEDCTRLALRA